MKQVLIVLFFVVSFCLGNVSCECNQEAKQKCIEEQKTAAKGSTALDEKCRIIHYVSRCIVEKATCSYEEANNARNEVFKELNVDCDQVGEGDDETCTLKANECENKMNADKVTCDNIKAYQDCVGQDCKLKVTSKRMAELMTKAGLTECPGITHEICTDLPEMEKCVLAYNNVLLELRLLQHTEVKCRLAEGLEQCLRSKGGCVLQTIKGLLKEILNQIDCSEYVDVCNTAMEADCAFSYANSKKENCEKLTDYRTCLVNKGTCPMSRIHLTLRNAMTEGSFDCSDINACDMTKLESCETELFAKVDTKENKCTSLKNFKPCMVAAKCNEKYMNNRIDSVTEQFDKPCGASSIVASIGLTLLLALLTTHRSK